MKKIILALVLGFLLIPIISFAKSAGEECTKADTSAKGCPSNIQQYPKGLACNIATDYKGNQINKCVNLLEDSIDEGDYCLEDKQCDQGFGKKIICNKATWKCTNIVDQQKDSQCLKKDDCLQGYYCKIKKNSIFGTCQNDSEINRQCELDTECPDNQFCKDKQCVAKSTSQYNDKCDNAAECASGLVCFVYPGNTEGECRYAPGSHKVDEECTYDSECQEGAYCPSVAAGKSVCQWKLANTATCQNDKQCSDGYCADENGLPVSNKSGTCRAGVKEGAECDTKSGSNKICASPLICKDSKCAKSITDTTQSLDQKAEQEKAKTSLGYQMNLYCDKEATPGLFTKGISNQCWNCGNCEARDIMVVIANVVNGTLQMVGFFAVFATIVSGFMYMISRGNEEKTGKAKAALTAAIIGMIIVFTGWILINTIMTVLGYNCGSWYAPTFNC